MRFFKKEERDSPPLVNVTQTLVNVTQINRCSGYGIGKIVCCNTCGGLFMDLECAKVEVVRRPLRKKPWVDHDYYCKHCGLPKEKTKEEKVKMKFVNIETKVMADGKIVQDLKLGDDDSNLFNSVLSTIIDTKEQQIRQALIAMGWTPPPATDATLQFWL